jgi:amidohydrolase
LIFTLIIENFHEHIRVQCLNWNADIGASFDHQLQAMYRLLLIFVALIPISRAVSQPTANNHESLTQIIDAKADAIEEKVIMWRRHLHQYPELSNREFETAKYIEAHLRTLKLDDVRTEVGITGVVGILKGGKPGQVVALRADMDALPVTERVDLPFASKVKTTFNDQQTGVMHACGHDTHVAILMATAEILASLREEIPGTVVFIFQPAEEGAPHGEEGGAALMIKEGVLDDPKVDVIYGLHISSNLEAGKIRYRPQGLLAAADRYTIKVKGKQTHGSAPWNGVDPVVVSAQIILGLQTIISRQTELTKDAAVITVGRINGGIRNNIIPETVEMEGTIRTMDTAMQRVIHEKIIQTATLIAQSAGAEAEVNIYRGVPVTYNHVELTQRSVPVLYKVAGEENVFLSRPITGAEDFSFFAEKIPGFFFFLGGMPKGMDVKDAAPHHTPDFYIDESGMKLGVRAMCNLIVGS